MGLLTKYPGSPSEIEPAIALYSYQKKEPDALSGFASVNKAGNYSFEGFELRRSIGGLFVMAKGFYMNPAIITGEGRLKSSIRISSEAINRFTRLQDRIVVESADLYPKYEPGETSIANLQGAREIAKLVFNLVNMNLDELVVVDEGHYKMPVAAQRITELSSI